MSQRKADYLIVGQGIAGSWLAFELIERGLSVQVIDKGISETSSKRAAGIYNPITGRKMVKTWRAEDLFLDLEDHYLEKESLLGTKFLHPKSIYRPFRTIEDQNDWEGRMADGFFEPFLKDFYKNSIGLKDIQDPYGGILLDKCGYLDLPSFLDASKLFLQNKGMYEVKVFDFEKLSFEEQAIRYEDDVFEKIIFCDGFQSNPFWELPFRPVRGEIIDIKCDLNTDFIVNQGVFMIPKGDRVAVGSTYDHNNLSFEPQESGIKSLQERLKKLYTGDFDLLEARAGVRPATHDRKPYIGLHQKYKTLGIFNGFGTKGVSLTPYFAKHFVDFLLGNCELEEEVNVQRTI
ncbi:MAG: FAD-binding oxidoreductase [Ekhidna sp.]|nr:FAD-binding oxidoreductase [Ekhidna sp.]